MKGAVCCCSGCGKELSDFTLSLEARAAVRGVEELTGWDLCGWRCLVDLVVKSWDVSAPKHPDPLGDCSLEVEVSPNKEVRINFVSSTRGAGHFHVSPAQAVTLAKRLLSAQWSHR